MLGLLELTCPLTLEETTYDELTVAPLTAGLKLALEDTGIELELNAD